LPGGSTTTKPLDDVDARFRLAGSSRVAAGQEFVPGGLGAHTIMDARGADGRLLSRTV
jgi:hypothetical protein